LKKILSIAFLIFMLQAGAQPLSQQLAKTAMTIWPDSFVLENDKFAKWRYDQGVILKGIEGIWYATGDAVGTTTSRKAWIFMCREMEQ
jgi:unsaturated rhamnogalacturonyl hydrolase